MSEIGINVADKLKAIVAENLPALAAGELKEFIEAAQIREKELYKLQIDHEETKKKLNDITIHFNDLKSNIDAVDAKGESNLKKEADLASRERTLEITLLKKELECAKEVTGKIFELTSTVFKNNVVKTNVFGSDTVAVPGSNGYQGTTMCAPMNRTSTTEVDV
jgi:hypothetical protein